MNELILTAVIGSSALAAAISSVSNIVIWMLNNKKQGNAQDDAEKEALQLLLYDRIKHNGLKYIHRGCITSDQLEDAERMHKCYHDKLGGNGYLDDIMNKVRKLPIDRNCEGV